MAGFLQWQQWQRQFEPGHADGDEHRYSQRDDRRERSDLKFVHVPTYCELIAGRTEPLQGAPFIGSAFLFRQAFLGIVRTLSSSRVQAKPGRARLPVVPPSTG